MAHLAVILDRAKRRSGLFQPFACGPHGIAALRTLAFEHPGFLLLRRGRLAVRVETGMGEGASGIEDRRDRRKEGVAGRSEGQKSEHQSPMRRSEAGLCFKKNSKQPTTSNI